MSATRQTTAADLPARGRAGSAADASRALVGAAVFAGAVVAFSRIPLLPDIGRDLHLTVAQIGLLTTSFGLGRLLMDLPAGRLSAAVPANAALAGAAAVLAASCALLAVSGSMLEALLASSLIGCASALTNTTGMYAFATATGAERRGASMALYATALMSGQMVGPVFGGILGSLAGWRTATAVSAGVAVAVVVVCLFSHRRARPLPGQAASASAPAGGAEADIGLLPPHRGELIALAAAPFATFFGLAGLTQTLIPVIGAGELALSPSTIGLALGGGAASRFLSAWVAGVGSDRHSRKVVLVPSMLLMALGAGVLALPPSVASLTVAIVLLAAGSSGIGVAAAALADRVPERRLGHELGIFRLLGDLGLLVGPIVAALLYQQSGAALAGGVSVAVFLAAAIAAAVWVREPSGPDHRSPERAARWGEDTGELVR